MILRNAILAAALLFGAPALADHVLIGTLVSPAGASVNNKTTAAPFEIPRGSKVDVQCPSAGSAVRFATGENDALVADSTSFKGIVTPSADTYAADLRGKYDVLAMIPVTAAATTCYVYSVVTR